MVDIKTLLPELRKLVAELAEDMLVRVTTEDRAKDAELRGEYVKIEAAGRTAQPFEEWRRGFLDQVAVAWVLTCVFVRFLEDNDLINECYIAGLGENLKRAEGQHEIYFRSHPHDTDREYLKDVFTQIGKLPAAKELFEEGKTPLWAVDPSGDAARRLLSYFREIDPERGGLKRTFGTPQTATQPLVDVYQRLAPQARFLGDLYQDLSEYARKRFALLQTPEFVEEFILDRTLTPALDEFGLKNLRLIDATCGSGHFLLGAFDRLFRLWLTRDETRGNEVVAAQYALESLFGVDINPFAIAITRFRLIVAAVQACGLKKLNQQTYAWKLNLAVGDSLLWGAQPSFGAIRVPLPQAHSLYDINPLYCVENPAALRTILGQGYHVVVGNPPYITVKDKAQNEAYRRNYPKVCHRQYSLGVPFTQRFWDLAIRKSEPGVSANGGAGYVGMITANSFMKREFGKKLIEEFFPEHDLTHVIDTSGAYIPGHGTPTVILFGRARKPVAGTVRAVLGIKGEPTTPDDPAQGLVWRSILKQIDIADAQDEFVSTVDVPRDTFASHPWSIGGGGAAELKDQIETGCSPLSDTISLIGYICMTRADDIYFVDSGTLRRWGFSDENIIINVEGDTVRDWSISQPETAVFPYDKELRPIQNTAASPVIRFLWQYQALLWTRREPNGDHRQLGLTWYEWSRFQRERFRIPQSIAFAFVATHNHFVFDRGDKVFKQSAPIIKLPADATEEDYLALLGVLNSSTACFWMHQVFHNKGRPGANAAAADERWEFRFEHDGTKLQSFPIPDCKPVALARQLDRLAAEYASFLPAVTVLAETPTSERLRVARSKAVAIRNRMIALQEELDWHCYHLYGLMTEDLRYTGNDLPSVPLGQRAFEIVMARRVANGELETAWFNRLGSAPKLAVSDDWPAAYRSLVDRRIGLIETNKELGLIEAAEFKRRWQVERNRSHPGE